MALLSFNRFRHPPGGLAQGRIVEMDVAIGGGSAPVSEQASCDMQALPVQDRVGSVRMAQVMQPRSRHDRGRIAEPKGVGDTCEYFSNVTDPLFSSDVCRYSSLDYQIWAVKLSVPDFHVYGWGPVVVKRYMEGEQLVWEYFDGSVTYMDRICTLPEDKKVQNKRGPRYKLF